MTLGVATLLRVSLLLAICTVWVIAEAQQEEDTVPEWLLANSGEDEEEATNIMMSTRKPKPGWVRGGTSCLNTDECGRGKCCLRRNNSPRRRCRRFQRVGEPCTEEQMMGGYYYGHCPCNINGVCTYTNNGLRCIEKKKEQQPELPPQQAPTQPPAIHPGSPTKEEESEENQGKPSGPAKPSGQDNELPELEFEKLRGPGDNGNAIPPFVPSSSRNPPTSASSKPGATAQSGFGQGGNEITPVAGTLPQGGIETPGQPQHPAHVQPPTQPPKTPQGSGPSVSTQGPSVPSPLSPPTTLVNSLLQPGGPSSTVPLPSMPGGNSRFPSPPGLQPRPPIPSPSHLPRENSVFPQAPEQRPLPHPPSPLPTQNANGLPPIAEEGPSPPPLPPSPLQAGLSAGAD